MTEAMSGASTVIRKLERKDREKAAIFVKRMMRSTMKSGTKGGYSRELLDHLVSTAMRTLDLSLKDPNHFSLIAVRDGDIIGIALGQVLGGVGRIDWIAVSPESQRQGVGDRLMGAVEGYMLGRECHKMTLFAFDSRIPAIGLCLKWGMVPEATLKQHEWGDSYVVMSKWLEKTKRGRT